MPDLMTLAEVARQILPQGCGIGVADPTQLYPMWPGEQLKAPVAKRLAEFSAGRAAARQALAEIGESPVAIPQGADRAPIWPAGISGSISHSRTACLATVSTLSKGLGVDLEDARPLPAALWGRILSASEQSWAEAQPAPGLAALLVFSAKEAAYKAQFPHSRLVFDFDVLALEVDGRGFTAQFQRGIAPFDKGYRIQGAWARVQDQILTAAWL